MPEGLRFGVVAPQGRASIFPWPVMGSSGDCWLRRRLAAIHRVRRAVVYPSDGPQRSVAGTVSYGRLEPQTRWRIMPSAPCSGVAAGAGRQLLTPDDLRGVPDGAGHDHEVAQ